MSYRKHADGVQSGRVFQEKADRQVRLLGFWVGPPHKTRQVISWNSFHFISGKGM